MLSYWMKWNTVYLQSSLKGCFNLHPIWRFLLYVYLVIKTLLCSVGFTNHTGNIPIDWTLGAFIVESTRAPLEWEPDNMGEIVGNDSVTYFLLFAFLLIAVFAAFFVLQWRKPRLKTIYDLEKGSYIVTRVPRWLYLASLFIRHPLFLYMVFTFFI